MRIRVEPRDVPLEAAARRLGLNQDEFDARYDNLIARVPAPDPDTGNSREAEPSPRFARCIIPVEGEPCLEMPCASRRGRVESRPVGLLLHFCAKCGAWGAFGYAVNLRAGRPGRWYCAECRTQGTAQ